MILRAWETWLRITLPPWRAATTLTAVATAAVLYGPGWWRDARNRSW